jgi:hypothetical protein
MGPSNTVSSHSAQSTEKNLIELSNACGGWVYFHDQAEETFISMDEWLQLIGCG